MKQQQFPLMEPKIPDNVRGDLVVSFSGGKTSAYMSHEILRRYSDRFNLRFVFANTGQELEKTLEFVNRCDIEFGLNLVWVEAVINPEHGKGPTHKIVSFKTASRDGAPFEAVIAKYGIPSLRNPHCSGRLKADVISHYIKSIGLRGCYQAIGIRSDEGRRKSVSAVERYNACYPLCDWFPTTRDDVNEFWWKKDFNLEIEAHEGNCQTCWKKSDRKLYLLALEHPERFEFMIRAEIEFQHVKPNVEGTKRVFFRQHRSAKDIIAEAQDYTPEQLRALIGADPDPLGNCADSCEGYS